MKYTAHFKISRLISDCGSHPTEETICQIVHILSRLNDSLNPENDPPLDRFFDESAFEYQERTKSIFAPPQQQAQIPGGVEVASVPAAPPQSNISKDLAEVIKKHLPLLQDVASQMISPKDNSWSRMVKDFEQAIAQTK